LKWVKPSSGRFKCNVDGSFSQALNPVGIGVCIRDDEGCFVLAKTKWMTHLQTFYQTLLGKTEWMINYKLFIKKSYKLFNGKSVTNSKSLKHTYHIATY